MFYYMYLQSECCLYAIIRYTCMLDKLGTVLSRMVA